MLTFEIHGTPEPQKQTRKGKHGFYDPSSQRREQIRWQLKPFAPTELLCGPLHVEITFLMPIPKATTAVRRRHMLNNTLMHVVRPDVDNLSYLVVNAMKDLIYKDDSQIVSLHVHKRYSDDPKTVVQIKELGQICL